MTQVKNRLLITSQEKQDMLIHWKKKKKKKLGLKDSRKTQKQRALHSNNRPDTIKVEVAYCQIDS